jgi:carboxymethylenebutenolidase
MEIQTASIQVPTVDLQIAAYVAEPLAEGAFPAVIVFQEVFGVNAHIRALTDQIAREGYVTIAPALYQRTAPGFAIGYSAEELALGRHHKEQTTAAHLLSDTQATIAYLKAMPQVQKNAIGCIGFCFGGHVAYLAATLPEIKATASFYGAGITTFIPGGGPPTITRTPEIKGRLYAFFGTHDLLIPQDHVDQVEAALKQHQIDHRVFRYSAGHGFCCDQRADYHSEAAADAWSQVQQLFQATLKSIPP